MLENHLQTLYTGIIISNLRLNPEDAEAFRLGRNENNKEESHDI